MSRVDLGVPGIVGDGEVERDPLVQRMTQQLRQLRYQARDIGRLRRQGLAAGERQKLLGQSRSAFGRRRGVVEAADCLGVGADIGPHEVEIGLDDLQDVVEIVRHAAGQLADRFHLLALPERRLVAQLFGDVDAPYDRATVGHVAARDLVLLPVVRNPRRQQAADRGLAELQGRQQGPHGRPLA